MFMSHPEFFIFNVNGKIHEMKDFVTAQLNRNTPIGNISSLTQILLSIPFRFKLKGSPEGYTTKQPKST
jgi:hypothetical protein